MRLWLNEGRTKLFIEHEAYGVGVETQEIGRLWHQVKDSLLLYKDQATGEMVPRGPQYQIRADNSRPETITYMRHYGYNVAPCQKWSGCVEDGIAWLRSLEQIVVHPRCKHTEAEATRLYKYKVDPVTGEVLPVIVDKHNHCVDAIRYACEPFICQTREEVIEVVAEMPSISPELDMAEYGISQW